MSDEGPKTNTEIRENVLEPALFLLKSQLYLEKMDTPDFLDALKAKGFASYEDAVKESGKLRLRQDDYQLYIKLLAIEKCRDYVRHSNNLAYIKNDHGEIDKLAQKDKRTAYFLLDEIVEELGRPIGEQQCRFDMATKKLHCSTPKLKEALIDIYKNKKAAELLTQLIRNTVHLNSLPNALHIYKAVSRAFYAMGGFDYILYGPECFNRPLWTLV